MGISLSRTRWRGRAVAAVVTRDFIDSGIRACDRPAKVCSVDGRRHARGASVARPFGYQVVARPGRCDNRKHGKDNDEGSDRLDARGSRTCGENHG